MHSSQKLVLFYYEFNNSKLPSFHAFLLRSTYFHKTLNVLTQHFLTATLQKELQLISCWGS